jgi:putative transposase
MPRGPRLDAPGTLHHVMVRGIEGRRLFVDDADRDEFVRRLAVVVTATGLRVYAWALLPNHAHLLVRTGPVPLARAMRSLLTGYAGAFNRRHRRRGHLFQNRYKSVVVEEEPYFLELVRYLHLNPLRAKLVPDLTTLDRYPYTGHAPLLGRIARPWQSTGDVLGRFARRRRPARAAYRDFVAAGIAQGRRPELQGGGLVRSAGGWAAVQALRHGRESYTADERVLGSSAFVEALQREVAAAHQAARPRQALAPLLGRVCAAVGIQPEALQGSGRRPAVTQARAGLAYLWVGVLGHSGRPLAAPLGIRPAAVYKAVRRGGATPARWLRLLAED